jgi:uncharacterized membrane protein
MDQDEIVDQDEINEREHSNPANWSSPFAFYHSDLDSRLIVPKQQAWMGRTLNMAHPIARVMVLVFVLAMCLVAAAIVFAVLPRD